MPLPPWARFIRASLVIPILGFSLLAGLLIGVVATSDTPSASAYQVNQGIDAQQAQRLEPGPAAQALAPTRETLTVTPAKPKKPKPATRERKAKNVPERPLDDNTGRRIVYDKSMMTVWVMDKKDEVVYRFPVVGRWDRPVAGKYKIYSQSQRSGNPNSKVTFDHMTRFAYGMDGKTPIGFHSIPKYYNGRMMHSKKQLGLPIATGGCIRMAAKDAKKLYKWAKLGGRVYVLASP